MSKAASLCPLVICHMQDSFKVLGWCERTPELAIDDICRITVDGKGVCEIQTLKSPPPPANGETLYQFKGKGEVTLEDAPSTGKTVRKRVALLMFPYKL